MWAIIGGTGFEKFEGFKAIEKCDRETPFGLTSVGFKKVELDGKEVLFIPRHGTDHDRLPTEVNFRANIFALKKFGATKLLAFSAVGSLADECAPGDLVIPDQFIDRTKGLRKTTFCGEGLVGHVSLAEPVHPDLVAGLRELASGFSFQTHFNRTLVVMEGPQFSTKAESHLYRSWKADIIGMTSFPEFALCREAGMAYINCCFVTDYDCWKDDIPHVTVEGVMKVMRENNGRAFEVAKKIVHFENEKVQNATAADGGLQSGLMTPDSQWTAEQKEWLETLIR